jgi:hypothetical protein
MANKFIKGFGRNLVNTTAALAVVTPMWAGVETFGFDAAREAVYSSEHLKHIFDLFNWSPDGLYMSETASQTGRKIGAISFYGGMGFLINGGRRASQNLFKITKESKERTKKVHDALYVAVASAAMTPAYLKVTELVTNETIDPPTVALATTIATAIGIFGGTFIGQSIDTYEDLMGVRKSERLHKKIRNLGKKTKIGLVALLTAAALGTTAGIYHFYEDKSLLPQTIEIKHETIDKIIDDNTIEISY